jgi:hypothetical protein
MPPLPDHTCKQAWGWAFDLLLKVQLRIGRIKSPPVSLDRILEFLELELEFDDIAARFSEPEGLGCMIVETRQIFIDQSLDPTDHPEMEGRLNYTIAHEIAHWYLHRRIADPRLLSDNDQHRLERQANCFAAFLLMPPWLVLKEWKSRIGYAGPLIITPDQEALGIDTFGSRAALITTLADQHASGLAPLFRVSKEAMRIRLEELELLPR